MTLPTSGPLGLSQIYREIYGVSPSGPVSLRAMADTSALATPDSISEFYGHDALTISPSYMDFFVTGDAKLYSLLSIKITAGKTWTIGSVPSWITIDGGLTGVGSGVRDIFCDSNETPGSPPRHNIITITSPGFTGKTLDIDQDGF